VLAASLTWVAAPRVARAQEVRTGPLNALTTCSLRLLLRDGRVELGAVGVMPVGSRAGAPAAGVAGTLWLGDGWGIALERTFAGTRGQPVPGTVRLERAVSGETAEPARATAALAALRLVPVRGKVAALGAVRPIDLDLAVGVGRAAGELGPSAEVGLSVFVLDAMVARLGLRRHRGATSATASLAVMWPLEPRRRCRCR
jgi:hypothetical protein